MTTAVRTQPQHGERACYLRGCRQPECRAAHSRYMKLYRVDLYRNGPRRVDATPYRAIINDYLQAHWSYSTLANLIGCSDTVIVDLVAGNERINPDVAARIDRIPKVPGPAQGRAQTDGTGTIRRARALVAFGYQVSAIAGAIGMHPDALSRLINREDARVLVSTAQTMAAVYRQWARKPGPDNAARRRAERLGWHGPIAWDSDTIDDPNAEPEVEDLTPDNAPSSTTLNRNQLAAERHEWIRKLTARGYLPSEIAQQLGMNPKSVRAVVSEQRAGKKRDRSDRNRKQVAA